MARTTRFRLGIFAVVLALGFASSVLRATAALDMSTGLRIVTTNAPESDCSAKAKEALTSQLASTFEAGAGTGQWLGYGPIDAAGHASAAAAIHCFPVGTGYVVTFTCAVELPPNPYSADDLCNRLAAVFQGKAAAAPTLATPTPVPTGCALNNLVGTWVSNDDPKQTLTMDANGGLTDQDGVVGSWALSGTTATITHYGTKTATLSSDGKHLNGGGISYTRKC
ncbi:MAG TPA: hypothetical protein VMH02_04425 [Verrucomicrobiae bacterium]|nr:hypothetical protein [Verrucomicrobiae bacterium]